MDGEPGSRGEHVDGPLARVALAVIAGIALGTWTGGAGLWLVLGVAATVAQAWSLHRGALRWAGGWGLVAVAGLAAAWAVVDGRPADIERYLPPSTESRLVEVVGEVASMPRLTDPGRGAMGRFSYQQPVTLADLDLRTVMVAGQEVPTDGRLRLRIEQADDRLAEGMVIRTVGWLSAVDGPSNPGEIDYRPIMQRHGIAGWLTVRSRDGWAVIEQPLPLSPLAWLASLRRSVSTAAHGALRRGLEDDPEVLSLCETMLLGLREREQEEQVEAFRRVGLAHLLSISGAHLGILMGLVLLVAKAVTDRPPRAWAIVLAALGLYLLAVPWRVPIVRAAVMVGLFAAARLAGRQARPTEVLAAAATGLLLIHPADLFDPGFQLSFGVVLALVVYAEPVAHWLWPRPELAVRGYSIAELIARRIVDYVAVSLVAFAVALPLVAYHFQLISPLAVVMGVLALPVVAMVLGLGYLKILVGLVLPSGGLVLTGLLGWVTRALIELVERAASWPGAAVPLPQSPTAAWVVAALVIVWAVLQGHFGGRRAALGASILLVLGWGALDVQPDDTRWSRGTDTAATLSMLAVGDGSCFVLQLPGGGTWMFDCGSQAYLDVGETSIVPALRAMGIDRLDAVVLSHADIDHYAGTIDVADALPIGRVLMPPHLLAEAETQRRDAAARDAPADLGPTAFLVDALRARGIPIETVTRGWSEGHDAAALDVLWPPAGCDLPRANDHSVVLSVRVAGRRILLTGDIQQDAITRLLALGDDLRADVIDLAHHGSFVDASPVWLAATDPSITLQSSGPARLVRDPWPTVLDPLEVDRYVTARDGLVQVRLTADGVSAVQTFRDARDSAHGAE